MSSALDESMLKISITGRGPDKWTDKHMAFQFYISVHNIVMYSH